MYRPAVRRSLRLFRDDTDPSLTDLRFWCSQACPRCARHAANANVAKAKYNPRTLDSPRAVTYTTIRIQVSVSKSRTLFAIAQTGKHQRIANHTASETGNPLILSLVNFHSEGSRVQSVVSIYFKPQLKSCSMASCAQEF
jgi:hypothetical protein